MGTYQRAAEQQEEQTLAFSELAKTELEQLQELLDEVLTKGTSDLDEGDFKIIEGILPLIGLIKLQCQRCSTWCITNKSQHTQEAFICEDCP